MLFRKFGVRDFVLLVSAVYVLHLGVAGKLNLYIHPRYILFTTAMTIIILFMLFIQNNKESSFEEESKSKFWLFPLVLILITAIIFPASSLTSSTVSQRSVDSGSIVTSLDSKPINLLFSGSSKGLKLSDWSRLLETNSDPDYYANKPVKVSGFIYDSELDADTALLARFVLTCCAIDAQPVSMPVEITNWQNEYQEDDWIEVEGQIKQKNVDGSPILVLIPDSVTRIEEPSNPYAN